MIVEKNIKHLKPGTFVVAIVKQTSNYILKQPGFVREQAAIDELAKEGVLRVAIDTTKKLIDDSTEYLNAADSDSMASESSASTNQKNRGPLTAAHLAEAKNLFSEAKQLQSKVLDDIKQGRPIKADSVVAMTDQCIDSIFTNPDALACVINIRIKDEYLLEHSISVSILCTIFGRFLEFDRDTISQLAVGAFLHDVGKIQVPDKVLNKPGRLTAEEFDIIKTHVVHSAAIVDETPGLSALSRHVVANHHEKLNGKGYPAGKNAKELDIYDRIITICDIYDALTADRVYKKGMPQTKAFAIVRELAQKGELDGALVDKLIRCLGVYPVGSMVRLNSGRLAMVVKVNEDNPLKPVVREFYSLRQRSFVEARQFDLANDDSRKIEQGVRADEFNLDMNKITEFLLSQG